MLGPRAMLRSMRHGIPKVVAKHSHGPGPAAAANLAKRLHRSGFRITAGYFQADDGAPEAIVEANETMAWLLSGLAHSYLSVKAPPLRFDPWRLGRIREAASAARLPLLFDSHAPRDADATLALVADQLAGGAEAGLVLPARWRRSAADAARFRDTAARIRIVKGEWPDPEADEDPHCAFLSLAAALAGRTAPVAIATHDPRLAEEALTMLRRAGTPCELEQLRGLPGRRTRAVARRLGVPIRIYIPFGPGWWPYAVNKALERLYLPLWMLRDLAGR